MDETERMLLLAKLLIEWQLALPADSISDETDVPQELAVRICDTIGKLWLGRQLVCWPAGQPANLRGIKGVIRDGIVRQALG